MPNFLTRFGRRPKISKHKEQTDTMLSTSDKTLSTPSTSTVPSQIDRPGTVVPEHISSMPTSDVLELSNETNPHLAEAKKHYNEAITLFDEAFKLYIANNPKAINLDSKEIAKATHLALSCQDTFWSGKVFGEAVQKVLDTIETDKTQPSIGGQMSLMLSKLFPLMKLALALTKNVADVFPLLSNF